MTSVYRTEHANSLSTSQLVRFPHVVIQCSWYSLMRSFESCIVYNDQSLVRLDLWTLKLLHLMMMVMFWRGDKHTNIEYLCLLLTLKLKCVCVLIHSVRNPKIQAIVYVVRYVYDCFVPFWFVCWYLVMLVTPKAKRFYPLQSRL